MQALHSAVHAVTQLSCFRVNEGGEYRGVRVARLDVRREGVVRRKGSEMSGAKERRGARARRCHGGDGQLGGGVAKQGLKWAGLEIYMCSLHFSVLDYLSMSRGW